MTEIPQDKTVKAAHTPTPWSIDVEEYDCEPDGRVIAGLITIREIARCLHDTDWAESEDWERDLANTAFIVKAVNAHDALVALAQAVAQHFENTDAPLGEQARAALVEKENK